MGVGVWVMWCVVCGWVGVVVGYSSEPDENEKRIDTHRQTGGGGGGVE